LQEDDVVVVTDPDETDLELTAYETDLLHEANGKVLLLYLRGAMIFGASRAISRKNSEVEGCQALVVDMTDVKHLGVSSAIAIEDAMLDMLNAGRQVYIVGAGDQSLKRLTKMGIIDRLPPENVMKMRLKALEKSIYGKELPVEEVQEA
jgi:SulP family sulfate permease